MRFNFGPPTDTLTLEDQQRWQATFQDVTFACTECSSEDTVETSETVPAGTHAMVRCHEGHVTVGRPPARFRAPVGA